MDLKDIAAIAIKTAKGEGAEEAEAYVSRSKAITVYVDDSRIKSVESRTDLGLGMRTMKDQRVGQSASFISADVDVRSCASSAVRSSVLVPQDRIFKHFPYPQRSQRQFNSVDRDIIDLDGEELADLVMSMVSSATAGHKVKVPNGLVRVSLVEAWLSNSNGTEVQRRNTGLYLHVTSMCTGGKRGEGAELFFSSRLGQFQPDALGRGLRTKALAASKARSFKGKRKMDVLVPPHELSELFHGSVDYALSAENVNRRRSPWMGKIGQACAESQVTLIDDPFDGRGLLGSAYDDEGTPTRRKVLVESGVLRGYLNDSYNAAMSSSEGTGNGLRRSTIEPMGQYQMPVHISPLNLIMSPGSKKVEALVDEIDEGILVQKFSSPDVHPITGAFALEVRCAHLVKKGEFEGTIDHCLLTGNMFEALMNVRGVARDQVVSGPHILPTVCFSGLELVGSE